MLHCLSDCLFDTHTRCGECNDFKVPSCLTQARKKQNTKTLVLKIWNSQRKWSVQL